MSRLEDHWRKDSFDRLDQVIDVLANGAHADLYADYLRYLNLKRVGRRKDALAAAERFISTYRHDPFEIRQRVCWSLMELTEPYWDCWPAASNWLFPGNIEIKFVTPMFEEWRHRQPTNVNAWLYPLGAGLEWGAETAFMLEPGNPRCQFAELKRIGASIGYAIHELDHIGFILDAPAKFSRDVDSLTAVAAAIGTNLADDARVSLEWLHALREAYLEVRDDLRPILADRGIVKPEKLTFYSPAAWFREPPYLWSR